MEQGLRQADFILCVLTPEYARKANDRDSPALHLSPSRIGDIVLERRGVTADTAIPK
jgi:hypothetical protein